MKLIEFEIANPAAASPSHGDTIAAGTVWIASIKVGFAGATGG